MEILFGFLICLVATTLGGISGIGGGVIIKPVMDMCFNLPVATISFLSGCTVLAMTISSLWKSRNGNIKIEKIRGTCLAIGAVIGGIAGKEVFEIIKTAGGDTVSAIQQIMMVFITAGVFVYTINKEKILTVNVQTKIPCLGIGIVLGGLSAFLGIGGGPINLAILFYFFSMDSKAAALHSLYIIFFSQTASFLNTVLGGNIPEFKPLMLTVMVLGGVFGGIMGRKISGKLDNKGNERLFLGLLVIIIGISCYNLWKCWL